MIDSNEFDDILWVGDLNWDPERQSGFSQVIKRFLEKIGLISVWTKFPIDYTHIHTDLKTTSVLDHFIVNERLLSVIEDCGVMHFGDNPSRHSPIMIKLRLDNLPVIVRKPQTIQQHLAWYKANVEDIDSYTENLQSFKCLNPCFAIMLNVLTLCIVWKEIA